VTYSNNSSNANDTGNLTSNSTVTDSILDQGPPDITGLTVNQTLLIYGQFRTVKISNKTKKAVVQTNASTEDTEPEPTYERSYFFKLTRDDIFANYSSDWNQLNDTFGVYDNDTLDSLLATVNKQID